MSTESKQHSERPSDVIREWFTGGSKKRWRTSCWHRAPDDVIAALDSLEEQLEALEQAFEHAIQHVDSLGYNHSGRYLRELRDGVSSPAKSPKEDE